MKIIKGFTLLELLVVIGLITILMSFGMASYSTAQKKARDSRRVSDMKSIQNALEQYYSICSYKYPLVAGAVPKITATTASCTVSADRIILSALTDPLGGSYQCVGTCDSSTFTICPPAIGTKYLETNSSCNTTNKSCCLSNQQ